MQKNGVLVKAFDRLEYAKDFIEYGKMKISNPRCFREIEDVSRKDKDEGIQKEIFNLKITKNVKTLNFGKKGGKNFSVNIKDLPEKYQECLYSGKSSLKITYQVKTFLYCMSFIEKGKPLQDFRENSELGDYIVVIKNNKEFIERIKRICPNIKYNFVEYVETKKDLDYDIFKKLKKDEKQREFRFLFNLNFNNDSKFIYIGNISDVAFIVERKKLFMSGE